MMMSRIEGRPLLGSWSMLVSGVGEETLELELVSGEVRTERTTLSVLVFAAFASLPGKQSCWQLVALLSEKQGI